jgi:type I restriction enzyme S subunit
MMAEQAKVPAIRFAGFTDPWEQRKLGELSSEFQSGDFISAEEILGSGPYPVYGGNGLRGYAKQYNHDGFYALIGRQGALCGNVNTAVGKAYFTEHAVAVKANFLHDTRFLAHLLGCMDLGRYSGQSAQPGLAVGVLKEVETTVPSKAEQQAIGSFFSRLDSLITLHQRKYDKLVIFKKSMLEKMFPKDGESVPEIRFAGFTDPWEQRKASEVFQIVDDRGHPTLPVLSATQNQGMIYRDDSGRYIGHDESNEIGYKRVLPGDFVVHLRSFQGGFAHSQYEGITSPAYTVFRAKEPTSHSDRFWKHWFMSEHFIAGLSTVTYGIRDGRSISVDEFMNTFLAFPAVEEQAAISRLFDYLDDLITLHQRKLELLQNIKKSLLDKMFV